VHRFFHRGGLELTAHDAPGFAARDQSCVAQHVEMLHHRRQRHRERLRQIAHRDPVALAEPRQQRPPGWIGESGKSAVQGLISILNHLA